MSQPEQRRILATSIPGPKSQKLQVRRVAELSSGLGVTMPVFIERAVGGILVDVDGNHIIDFASGIAVTSVGASDPAVVRRIEEQAERFTHTCFLVTEYEGFVDVAAARNLAQPGRPPDIGRRCSRPVRQRSRTRSRSLVRRPVARRVIVLGNAYHGRTLLTMTMTAKNVPYKQGFGPFAPEVYRVPSPYPYRWPSGPEKCAEEALAALRDTVLTEVGANNVAAIVAEPIQGEGGFIVPPAGYLKAVQEFAKDHGIVFIADEIQTGLGRTGAMFACEHEGVVPDLITTAKALGGGMPLSAVTGRAELMDAVPAGGLGGTYSGNPVACAAALGALETIEREQLVRKAQEIEAAVMPRLGALTGADSLVGEVRGRGAMLAIEFVRASD